MGTKRQGYLFCCLAAGCRPTIELPLAPGDEIQSLIVVFHSAEGTSAFALFNPHQDPSSSPQLVLDDDEVVEVVSASYRETLEELALKEGPLLPATRQALLTRGLPAAAELLVATLEESDDIAWRPLQQTPNFFLEFRLDGHFVSDCAELGGCVVAQAEARVCRVPCEPTPPPPDPPLPPEPPQILPCPSGWTVVAALPPAPELCEPWPIDRPPCPEDSAWFPGEAGCGPLGAACPNNMGAWPTDLPPITPVLFVRAGASGSGRDPADPAGSIGAVLPELQNGGVVAIAEGDYFEPTTLVLEAPIHLVGACAARTRLHVADHPGVSIRADSSSLRDLSIVGSLPRSLVLQVLARDVELDSLIVSGGQDGVLFESGAGRLFRVLIRDPRNRGLVLANGSRVEVDQLSLIGTSTPSAAIDVIHENTELIANRTALRVANDVGIRVHEGARARFDGLVVEGSTPSPLFVDLGSTVEVDQVLVRSDSRPPGSIVVDDLGRIEGRRLVSNGPLTLQSTSAVALDDLVLQVSSTVTALVVVVASSATLNRVSISAAAAIYAVPSLSLPSTLQITDLAARGSFGEGSLEDVLKNGFLAVKTRVSIERASFEGFAAGVRLEDERIDLTDVSIEDIRPNDPSPDQQAGLHLRGGALAVVDRLRIHMAHRAGVFLHSSTLMARNVSIEQIKNLACFETTCPNAKSGCAVVVVKDSDLMVDRFRFADNHFCGLQGSGAPNIRLQMGEIATHDIGINLPSDRIDDPGLVDAVVFTEVTTPIDTRDYSPTLPGN